MTAALVRKLAAPLTLREAVADQLRTAIVSGALQPGFLLKETELALRLGVSPTPVREALMDLSAEGLVEIEAHRLKRVTPIHLPSMLDLLGVQTALWRMGYVWSFPRIGAGEFVQLEEAVTAYRAALAQGDKLAAIRAGHDFHTIFISASNNRELLRVTLDRRSLIARFILLHGSSTVSRAGLRQHSAILDSARRGDTDDVLARLDLLATRMVALALPAGGRPQDGTRHRYATPP
jgi:DNA-binding GntR family transcriptional regulator